MTAVEIAVIYLSLFIGSVESNHNPNAIGDHGKALGVYQIHKEAWEDGCRFLKVKWKYEVDAFNSEKSNQIFVAYLVHYGNAYKEKTGKEPSLEVLARIWNGGPNGYKKESTKKYWKKVEKEIQKWQQ